MQKIEAIIYTIRNQRVMLDSDLAQLYQVETKALNRQVKRNLIRFPKDFMFQLSADEYESLRCQIGTSNEGRGGRRYTPFVFTELGVAMLSSILHSEQAALVNIAIMRTFVKLRSFLSLESTHDEKLNKLEKTTHQLFKIVFERLDSLESKDKPKELPNRRRIGLKT